MADQEVINLFFFTHEKSKSASFIRDLEYGGSREPHRGLPPWRGGEAYAPMTRTIF